MTFEEEIYKVINNKENMFIENYFELQKRAEEKYGLNALVFAEVGSFYEIYETQEIGKATEIAKTLNILLTRKNKKIKEISISNPKLCGIPSVSLEKHLEKLTSENKYTIVLISQEGRPPNIKRRLNKIISPGTNIDYIEGEDKKFIASIYTEKNREGVYSAGITLLDPTLGEILVYENYGKSGDKEIIIDEVNQILNTYSVSEVVAYSQEEDLYEAENVIYRQPEETAISYQEELIKHSFNIDTTHLSAIESLDIERMPFALNSLTTLLDFVIEHNRLIGISLQKPKQIYSSKYMYLGNDPLHQMDVHNDNGVNLLSVINKGITAIGRRYIKECLLNPMKDKNEIEDRLATSKEFVNYGDRKKIEDRLRGIYDIERILRKCEIKTIQPFEMANLYKSVSLINQIKKIRKEGSKELGTMIVEMEEKFDFEIMSMSNLTNITQTFVKKGIIEELDNLQVKMNKIEMEKDLGLNEVFVLKESETEGFYYEISKKKYEDFSHEINHLEIENVKALKGSNKIYIKELTKLYQERVLIMDKIVKITREVFYQEIEKINTKLIRACVEYICKIEFYINNAKLFESKAYSVPEFVVTQENFYEVQELRHPIVESFEREVFVPNNIQFGKKENMQLDTEVCFKGDFVNGHLLYGQNSSGKTVLSKSIGLSIIMAQAGFFVPAKSLKMSIFESLFTRITGRDDISRGLSTFAVEMLELKNILNRSNERSMVIGDEISHGTETISGLSIVASTILELKQKNASFIIATHLHQLDSVEEIKNENRISEVHLSLNYDQSSDKLIYNRKLQKGKGSSIYGLEFAKSLKMPEEFLTRAYKIRKEIAEDLSGLEELTKKRKSKYNSSVYIGVCSECGGKAEDIHHIAEQKNANTYKMVEHMRIHHKANLKPLCKACHDKEHGIAIKVKSKDSQASQ